MTGLAAALVALFAGLSALHAYWAAGGLWPGTDERSLVERVIGRTAGMRMPPVWLSAGVAAALAAAALLVAAHAGWLARGLPRPAAEGAMIALALVFAVRGAAGYAPAFNRSRVGTPFARLNARFYSPLCFGIAAATAVLLIGS